MATELSDRHDAGPSGRWGNLLQPQVARPGRLTPGPSRHSCSLPCPPDNHLATERGINFNKGYFLPTYEVIYLIAKPDFVLAPQANSQGDVWHIPQEGDNPHPAPFPVELAQRCIEATTARIVLGPLMGSESTAIAAETARRDWIGLEISEDYCKVARERIAAVRRLIQ